ncbi:MAG TPA: hypothetical protein VGP55_00240 [Chitinophagaceae bacterium]|nr:hypothetical protein [Chitinophagaceae bacterium]
MKYYLLSTILLSIGLPSFCQKISHNHSSSELSPAIRIKPEPHFYLSIHGGYAFALGSTFKFYPDNISSVSIKLIDNNPPVKDIDYKDNSKGLGDGVRAGIGLSYVLNDFINVGIDVDYFKTSINKLRDSSYYSSHNLLGNLKEVSYDEQDKMSYETSILLFSPNITFKAITRQKFFIYSKLGAIVIYRPSTIQREDINGNYSKGRQGNFTDSTINIEKRYEWGIRDPAFGFMCGIGGQAKVTEKIRAFAELQFSHIIFKERNRVLTNYIINGNEMIETLSQSEKEIVFKTDYKTDYNTITNPDEPSVATYQKFPITYAGLQLGIIYRF